MGDQIVLKNGKMKERDVVIYITKRIKKKNKEKNREKKSQTCKYGKSGNPKSLFLFFNFIFVVYNTMANRGQMGNKLKPT